MKTKGWPKFCLGSAAVLFLTSWFLLIVLGFLGVKEFRNMPRLVSEFKFDEPALPGVEYSPAQNNIIQKYGAPEGFYILFYQREGIQGDVEEVRYEQWDYFSQGIMVIFENGEELNRSLIPVEIVSPTSYKPESFSAFITREQVAASAGLDEWLILPVEDELVSDADLYYAEGMTFGLQDGELVYIETMIIRE